MNNKAFENSYTVLYNIFKNKAYSNIELNKMLESIEENDDKSLITKLVYGVLETNIELEYIIRQFAGRVPRLPTYIIVKIGAYASLYLNGIPDYAIVNELVNLTKVKSKPQEAGFVNAVLKKIINRQFQIPEEKNRFEYLSFKYSYPMWLLKKLNYQYGAKSLEQLISYKSNDLTHIRVNKNLITVKEFKKLLTDNKVPFTASVYENAMFVSYRRIKNLATISNLYTVQSLGSMLIVNSFEIKDNSQILDVCSAPGGKACYMAEQNPKGEVLALDLHEHRVELTRKYANRLELKNVTAEVEDATKLNESYVNKFDYVLVDAPCSGIGVISKKPDILLFKNEDSIKELVVLQANILNNSGSYVKAGGELIYSTCTLLKEENIDIVNAFLKAHKDFELIEVNLPEINHIKIKETVTLLPDAFNSEGYFVARMKRK